MTATATAALHIRTTVTGAEQLRALAAQLASLGAAVRRGVTGDLGRAAAGVAATGAAATRAARPLRTLEQELDRLARSSAQAKITAQARELLNGVPGTPRVVGQLRTVEGEMMRLQRLAEGRAVTAEARRRLNMDPSILTGHGFVNRGRQTLGLVRDMTVAGMGMHFAFRSAAAGLGAVINPVREFEQSLAEVRTKGGFNATQMDAIRKTAETIGRTKGSIFGAREAAGAGVELAAAGLGPEAIAAQLQTVLRFSQASGLETGVGAATLVETAAQFGKTSDDFTKIGDVMVKAANMSTISVGDMTESLKYVGPIANTAGVSLEQTAAMVALLGERGIKGSMAGTSLRTMLTSLVQPAKQAKTAMAEIGLSKEELQKGLSDIPGFMRTLAAKMDAKGFSQAQRLSLTKRLFGAEGLAAVEALMKTMTEKTADGTTAWEKYRDGVAGASGAMAATANVMGNTLDGKIKALRANVESAQLAIGEAMIPTLNRLIPRMADAAVATAGWVDRHRGLVDALVSTAPALVAGGLGLKMTSGIVGALNALPAMPAITAAGMSLGSTFAAAIAAGLAGYGLTTALLKALDIDMERVGASLFDVIHGKTERTQRAPRGIKDAMALARERQALAEEPLTDPILKGMAEGAKGVPASLAPRAPMTGLLKIEITQEGKARVANAEAEGGLQLEVGRNVTL